MHDHARVYSLHGEDAFDAQDARLDVTERALDPVTKQFCVELTVEQEGCRVDAGVTHDVGDQAQGFGPLRERHFPYAHTGPAEQVILDRILSVSFIAALPPAGQNGVAAQIQALIAATPELAGNGEVTFPYDTAAFSCTKL